MNPLEENFGDALEMLKCYSSANKLAGYRHSLTWVKPKKWLLDR
jgi:hypothetical protein